MLNSPGRPVRHASLDSGLNRSEHGCPYGANIGWTRAPLFRCPIRPNAGPKPSRRHLLAGVTGSVTIAHLQRPSAFGGPTEELDQTNLRWLNTCVTTL